jgi:NADH-quinone oxidoreductase subunit M
VRAGSRFCGGADLRLASLPLLTGFDAGSPGMQFVERRLDPGLDIHYNLGVDGISVALIAADHADHVLVLIGAWGAIDKRVSQYWPRS